MFSRGLFRRPNAERNNKKKGGRRQTPRQARRFEVLEERCVLAAIITLPPSSLGIVAGLVGDVIDFLPDDISDNIPPEAIQLLNLVDSGTVYQAFPGEVNDVQLFGDLANVFLLLRETTDVSLIRASVPPAIPPFTRDILDLVNVNIDLGFEIGGSIGIALANLEGGLKAQIAIKGEQLLTVLKNFFDITDARAIIPNATALLDLVPDLQNVVDIMEQLLTFDISSVIPVFEVEPILRIGRIRVLGTTIFPGVDIPPAFRADLTEFLQDRGIPTSLRDVAEAIPGPVRELVEQITNFLDFFKNDFISDSVYISTLDGPDTIDFAKLTGIPVQVYAGAGSDTITSGGGVAFLESFLDPFDIFDFNLFDNDHAKIELFGEGGTDTFILPRRFSSLDLNIDGGSGNDRIVVQGTPHDDIIELTSEGGMLKEIRFIAPDPNGGVAMNEVQTVTLPSGTNAGTFTLTFQNHRGNTDTTAPIPYDATAEMLRAALVGISSIASGDVAVTGLDGGPWNIEFTGALMNVNQPVMMADGSELRRRGGDISVIRDEKGNPETGVNEVQSIQLPPNNVSSIAGESRYVTGGTFTLSFEGATTDPIAFNASRSEVQERLEGLSSVTPGEIEVTGVGGGPWFVEFAGSRALTPQSPITADGGELTGGVFADVDTSVDAVPRKVNVALPSLSAGAVLPTGGTFTLSLNNGRVADTSVQLAYNASAVAVRAALEGMASIGAGNASVQLVVDQNTALPVEPRAWEITLMGLAAQTSNAIGLQPIELTGGVGITILESNTTGAADPQNPAVEGGFGENEVQRISSPLASGGTFTLRFVRNDGLSRTTGNIPFDATIGEMQSALENLASIGGADNVQVLPSSSDMGPWLIEFTGALGAADQMELIVDGTNLVPDVLVPIVTPQAGTEGRTQTVAGTNATGGGFRLAYSGTDANPLNPPEVTDLIAAGATALEIEEALELLPSLDAADVRVSGNAGGVWTITFEGALAAETLRTLVVDGSELTGDSVVSLEQPHRAGGNELQTISFSTSATGGDFTLQFDGETTNAIPYNATGSQVQQQLENLPGIDAGDLRITPSGAAGGPWTIEFIGRNAFTDVPDIVSNAMNLAGGFGSAISGSTPVQSTVNEQQTILFDPAAGGGTFQLLFEGQVPTDTSGNDIELAFDAPAQGVGSVQAALETIPSLTGNITVGGTPGNWNITFSNVLAGTDVSDLRVAVGQLRRNEPILVQLDTEASLSNEQQLLTLPGNVDDGSFTLSFASILISEQTPGDDTTNEVQLIELPAGTTGGQFRLTFRGQTTAPINAAADTAAVQLALQQLATIGGAANVNVSSVNPTGGPWTVEFTGALTNENQPTIKPDSSDLQAVSTAAIEIDKNNDGTVDVSVADVQQALEQLPAIGSSASVRVTGGLDDGVVVRTARPDANTGTLETQLITLPTEAAAGTFTITFDGNPGGPPALQTTGPISWNAPASGAGSVQAALEGLPLIDTGDVSVSGPDGGPWEVQFSFQFPPLDTAVLNLLTTDGSGLTSGQAGPWTVEFVGALGGVSIEALSTDGSLLEMQGGGTPTIDSITHGGNGEEVVISTKRFSNLVSVEKLVIEGGEGDDRLVIKGEPNFGQGLFFDGGDGNDVLELVSRVQSAGLEPAFIAPIFPGDDQATLLFGSRDTATGEVSGTNIQFASVEGEIIFDAGPIIGRQTRKASLFTNEIQVITLPAGTSEFTITLDFEPDSTPDLDTTILLPFSASATEVREALEDLDVIPIGPNTFTVNELGPGSWEIEFGGRFAIEEQQPLVTAVRKSGFVSLSGTDDGNDIRFFAGPGAGDASFSRDGQVRITLADFDEGSSVELLGQQGDDTISVATGGITEFATISINGGGPAGADAVRFEGTPGADQFTYQPSGAGVVEDGQVTIGTVVNLSFAGVVDVSFIGLGGIDSLTLFEPKSGSNDFILFNPEVGNNGSFQLTSQDAGPETALVYAPVSFTGIENRVFDTGTGSDVLAISTDSLPGVNSSVTVTGNTGANVGPDRAEARALFGDQPHVFRRDTTDPDILSLEVGTVVDDVTVTPGAGLNVAVNTGLGLDVLTYNAVPGIVEHDWASATISQAGVGNVTYTSAERVHIAGTVDNGLLVKGAPLDNRFTYQPLSATGGTVGLDGFATLVSFTGIGGAFTIEGNLSRSDEVVVLATNNSDTIMVDGPTRTVRVDDVAGQMLKEVTLDNSVEGVTVLARGGDDSVLVIPDVAAGNEPLNIQLDGGSPSGFDRLVVKDDGPGDVVRHHQGADSQSGTVVVGLSPPVDYEAFRRVDILPLINPNTLQFDPVSGGTGSDGLGRIVVFHDDTLEQNDDRLNPTELTDLAQSTTKPNIDPGGVLDPFGMGFDLPGDEDWYRFIAPKIGTFRFSLLFDPVGQLPNNRPGLPGDGQLQIQVHQADGTPINKVPADGLATHTIGVEEGVTYLLRVRGATTEAINVYDITTTDLDEIGPQVTDVFITAEPQFNLFNPKPSDGPTPLVDSLTIRMQDLVERFPGFLYEALDQAIAETPGLYRVTGDQNGNIPIRRVRVINDPVIVGQVATASILLEFYEPLPDDRFTLTLSDSIVDPVGNKLDGESNAAEPQDPPDFITRGGSGDSVPGGDFVSRFTVDSRPEVAVWAAGSVYVDTNGNSLWDPTNLDYTNRDITYVLGLTSDDIFAGNFSDISPQPTVADGFDKLAGYGFADGSFRWLIDTTNDGVPDIVKLDPAGINGVPFAGNFDGNKENGDEVGLFTGDTFWFDTDHDYNVDMSVASNLRGYPIIGDFNGDGRDDLATWSNNRFFFDLATSDFVPGGALPWDGLIDAEFAFGFAGVTERPVAADMNGDGYDDVGLWVPNRSGATPTEAGEWYFLLSIDPETDTTVSILDRIVLDPTTNEPVVNFTPIPFGRDILAQFGDEFAVPVIGNFDPPVTSAASVGPLAEVVDVMVSGTRWSDTFRSQVDSERGLGFSVPLWSDANVTELLPWVNVDQISVRFSGDLPIESGDLAILGVNVTNYVIAEFSYDRAMQTATWTLDGPIATDKVLLELTNDALRDMFSLPLNVVPGDVDNSGNVGRSDIVRSLRAFSRASTANAARYDIDASGSVGLIDLAVIQQAGSNTLPAGSPGSSQAAPASLVEAVFLGSPGPAAIDPAAADRAVASLRVDSAGLRRTRAIAGGRLGRSGIRQTESLAVDRAIVDVISGHDASRSLSGSRLLRARRSAARILSTRVPSTRVPSTVPDAL